MRLDATTGGYVASGGKADDEVAGILKQKNPAERLRALRASAHPQAKFVWAALRDEFHYAALHLESIASSAAVSSFALRWGFGWSQGPFETWQAAGWETVAGWVQADIDAGVALARAALPAWVFSPEVKQAGGVHNAQGSYSPQQRAFVPRRSCRYRRQVFRATLFGDSVGPEAAGKTVFTRTMRCGRGRSMTARSSVAENENVTSASARA